MSTITRLVLTVLLATGSLTCYNAANAEKASATYTLTFDVQWTAQRTPYDYPANAHMSGLIGLTHTSHFSLFADGDTASSGLELVAENGRPGILKAQFDELRRRERIGVVIEGPPLKTIPGSVSTTFELSKDHPFVSAITMLAPSPDWFTGVADVRLFVDGKWVESVSMPLWVWDAGTDSGETYTAKNADTQPRQSIRLLAGPHVLHADGLVSIGTAILKRKTP